MGCKTKDCGKYQESGTEEKAKDEEKEKTEDEEKAEAKTESVSGAISSVISGTAGAFDAISGAMPAVDPVTAGIKIAQALEEMAKKMLQCWRRTSM